MAKLVHRKRTTLLRVDQLRSAFQAFMKKSSHLTKNMRSVHLIFQPIKAGSNTIGVPQNDTVLQLQNVAFSALACVVYSFRMLQYLSLRSAKIQSPVDAELLTTRSALLEEVSVADSIIAVSLDLDEEYTVIFLRLCHTSSPCQNLQTCFSGHGGSDTDQQNTSGLCETRRFTEANALRSAHF